MISGPLLQRGYVLPLCKYVFPEAFLLIKITCPFLLRIILPRSNRMNTLERLLNIAFMVPPHISSHVARQGQHVRTTHSSIKVQTKSKEKAVNRYLFIGIICISQKLTNSQHYLDACLLFRCWLKAVSTISWRLAVLELLGNSSSLTRPVLSNTRWILGHGTLKRSQNHSNMKERFMFLDCLVLLVDIASWLCDQHRPLKRN